MKLASSIGLRSLNVFLGFANGRGGGFLPTLAILRLVLVEVHLFSKAARVVERDRGSNSASHPEALAGNGMHIPTMACWIFYILSHVVPRDVLIAPVARSRSFQCYDSDNEGEGQDA